MESGEAILNTANTIKSNVWDVEAIIDQVWTNLDGRIPRTTVYTTVVRLLEKYDNAVIRLYVPLLVHREAVELLRSDFVREFEGVQ